MKATGKLEEKWKEGKFLCVGLDTDPEKTKGVSVLEFNKKIVDATHDLVCAYKLNSAFYENGRMEEMRKTVEHIKEKAPDVLLIADAKRGDIGNTNEGYAYLVDDFGFDSMTIHSYMGREANEPFLFREEKLFFALSKTSNPGSGEFQDLDTDGLPLYLRVAKNVKEKWNGKKNCGIVVGATYPEHMMRARDMAGDDVVLLIPGIGAQGGDLEAAVRCGLDSKGGKAVINMSRSVIYADDPRKEAEKFNSQVAEYLKLPRRLWKEERREYHKNRTLEIFRETGAVLMDDHFVYQTGAHGSVYVAKDKITPNPLLISEIGRMIAEEIKDEDIDTVAAPAVGGIVLGHAVARHLSHWKGKTVNSVFIEKAGKDESGKDAFRITRDYGRFLEGKKVAVIEDIVNSGHSIKKVIDCVKEAGGEVTVAGIIWNRGGTDIGTKLMSLVDKKFEKYDPGECPLCKSGIPINTDFGHGSRK